MALETMQDLLIDQLRDLYNAESQLVKALPKMAKAATNPTLAEAFRQHFTQTEGHVSRLEQIFERLDTSPRGKKCKGMEGLVEEAEETMDEDGEDTVMDAGIIADAQRVEHYEIAAYGTAKTLAGILGQQEIVQLLDATLHEEKEADQKLTEIAEREVNPQAAHVGAGRWHQ